MNKLGRISFLFLVFCLSVEGYAQVDQSKRRISLVIKEGDFFTGTKDTCYFVDENGERINDDVYNSVGSFGNHGQPAYATIWSKQSTAVPHKYGYVNHEGKKITPFKYDKAFGFFDEDLAPVAVKEYSYFYRDDVYHFGYINTQGEEVIPLVYRMAYPFSDGLAAVKKNRKFGFINGKNQTVLDFKYDDVKCGFIDGYAWVKKGNKWGMIDKTGKTIVPFCQYLKFGVDTETGFANGTVEIKGRRYDFWEERIYDAKGRRYDSREEREVANKPKRSKPRVEWEYIPKRTAEPTFKLTAEVISESTIEDCFMLFHDDTLRPINLHTRKPFYYTLFLKDGINTIFIYAKNAGGETIEERQIEYHKPNSTIKKKTPIIEWPNVPTQTKEQLFVFNAQIKSDSKIDSCKLLLNGNPIDLGYSEYKGASVIQDFDKQIVKTLTLRKGENTIQIKVWNTGGMAESTKSIVYDIPEQPKKAEIVWHSDCPEKTIKAELPVQIEIRSSNKIESCLLSVNGKPIDITSATKGVSRVSDYDRQITKTVQLNKGKNTITLTVTNAGGENAITKEVRYYPCENALPW